ncbi:hypothetical protein L9F63_024059, partial [Diploptera punctata]
TFLIDICCITMYSMTLTMSTSNRLTMTVGNLRNFSALLFPTNFLHQYRLLSSFRKMEGMACDNTAGQRTQGTGNIYFQTHHFFSEHWSSTAVSANNLHHQHQMAVVHRYCGQHHYCCDDETTILHTRSKISWSYCPIKLIKHVFVKVQLFSLNAFHHQYKVSHLTNRQLITIKNTSAVIKARDLS